jgi:uncharacterized membrane protein
MKTVIKRISILFVLLLVVTAFALSQHCKAILKNGTQCKRKAQAGSIYCRQHTRMYGNGSIKSTAPVKTEQTAPAEPELTTPAKTEQTSPAKTEPTTPAKTEQTSPAKTEPTTPAKTEPTSPAKTEPTSPAKTE